MREYRNMLVLHIEEAEKIILKKCVCVVFWGQYTEHYVYRWFKDVQNIFYLGNKRKMVPLDDSHLERFFDSVSVLMSNILRQLALDSIADYSELFSCNEVCLCACVCAYMHV